MNLILTSLLNKLNMEKFIILLMSYFRKKVFGVGNKNYRILCEKDYKNKYSFKKEIKNSRCNTHPHQIYYEILSEHGIFGLTILIICLLGFVYTNFVFVLKKKFLSISLFFNSNSLYTFITWR